MIKDKEFGDVRELLKNIRGSLNEDLQEFSKINPEWGNLFNKTEDTYSRLKGRDTLQELLIDNPTNFGSETFSYNQLAKNIKDPKTAYKIELAVKKDPELLERIDKLGIAASAYGSKIARNPNPSGTAGTHAVFTYLTGALGATFPAATIKAGALGALLSEGLINKKFLDAAISYAEKPSISTSMRFSKAIKDITDKSPIVLARELERLQSD